MPLRFLNKLLQPHTHLLVAFSGGLDSTVLLHQLVTLRDLHGANFQIRAMHIHHGLSPYADNWAEHCQQVCEQWNVPFEVKRVQLADDGLGIEAHARAARYQALAETIRPDEVLLTAQHLDDQCETFLLALKRGSGPAGLAAMPERLPFGETELIRPLLGQTRKVLEAWANEHQLTWIEDESNQDDSYDRNFLRLRVIPEIQQRWPHFPQSVARSAELCGEQEQLLDELLAEQLEALIQDDGSLLIEPLKPLSDIRRSALLRRWFGRQKAAMPSRAALARLWNEVATSREDANPRLKFGSFEVRRYQGALYWLPLMNGLGDEIVSWSAPFAPLTLPGGLGTLQLASIGQEVRIPGVDEPVTVRFKASGQFHIVGRERGRSLKKIWQESGIAPWQRERTPLLYYGEKLIAALGVFVTQDGKATEELCWHVDWQKENKS
ncbi:tRNA lysidine(34) synthetase TilS [Buttiauxella sp. S04-F03]|uniref:tRNA lysidine(34) synthetase TilS n=1 Tax=Buttiauxella sp. S04-F03 TaxID=2904525 RepID=UPI001E51C08A|nr:tRNA lysidine(34) synthetase TilS [Buttiauxella sp. S04-F03]MCE0813768.1 tRNA lysidine(34) synthetase TilS [Buttiauxella sp. S04-F03]